MEALYEIYPNYFYFEPNFDYGVSGKVDKNGYTFQVEAKNIKVILGNGNKLILMMKKLLV